MELRYAALSHADIEAWSALTNTLARVDGTDEFYEPEDLAEELEEPGFDPSLDSMAVWAGADLVGYGQLRLGDGLTGGLAKATLVGGVLPGYRGRGIGREIMDRMESRARALAASRQPDVPLALDMPTGLEGSSASRMAAVRGYAPVRYFTDMRVDLKNGDLPPAADHVDDVEVQEYRPELSEDVRRAHNEAFADHWGSIPRSGERWADQMASRSFRPALSRVILGDDGSGQAHDSVEAYALCNEWVPGELYVSLVGTRRRARGRGMAARLLASIVGAAAAVGYDVVDLTVDAESPTGAGRVYDRAGFRPVRTTCVHRRIA